MRRDGRRPGIGRRRRFLFVLIALMLLYAGYAWYAGLAFTAGIGTQDMDWDGDGRVTTQETLQSWYAITVRTTREGARVCHSFYRRGQEAGEPIRVDCRTSFDAKGE
jgi:hypothetical protein